MFRRSLVASVAVSLLITLVNPATPLATAGDDPTSRFEGVEAASAIPGFVPLGTDPARRVTVFVEMIGDPVAVVKGNSTNGQISDAQKQAIKTDLRAKQDALAPQLQARGAQVLAYFQVALNGIKIDVSRTQLASIATLPGVTAIREVETFTMDNATSVPYIGAPAVWAGLPGFRGEGVKIGIIDTGEDYTHANFGGPGTADAYTAAHATSTLPADPALFGPAAPKIKGGTDLVGDDYNAGSKDAAKKIPHPDPNPLDCAGHGSHVGGTAAGFGVTSAGATYSGPYDSTTYSTSFAIGPGVAPLADIYAIRVFGCAGSTNVVDQAIEWAVDHDMDVINMSLGSPFGSANSSSAVAATNAAKAGVTVVASAGNNGQLGQYITGSPASGDGVISVAANDSTPSFPGVRLNLSTGQTITTLNANGATAIPSGALPVKVLKNADGTVSLGCDPAEYAGTAGMLVVTQRGSCARVARAIFGQQAGAAAVAMINNASGYPPFEGAITSNPDTGEQYTVTIPFLGVNGTVTGTDGVKLIAANGGTTTLAATSIANPTYTQIASFSSSGPRNLDSVLKPDITAPGVSIRSTLVGSGNQSEVLSGTSMAAPHVAGVAALTRQAHPTWSNTDISAAIADTGKPSAIAGYATNKAGTGLVQPAASTATQVVATGDKGFTSLRFGFKELAADYTETKTVLLRNNGTSAATFNVSRTNNAGRAHSVAFDASSITVPAGGTASVAVTLTVPAASAGSASGFREVVGLVTFTPATSSDNNNVTLRIPYYLVPRPRATVQTTLDAKFNLANPTANATSTNATGVIAGSADFYAWGLESTVTHGSNPTDLRAAGVQSFASGTASAPDRQLLVFAINTWGRWSNAATNEYDIDIDLNGDGTPEYIVFTYDYGAVTSGTYDGRVGAFVYNVTTKTTAGTGFLATAPTNDTILEVPVFSTSLSGLNSAHPRFSYAVASFAAFGPGSDDVLPGVASYNPWTPAISQGQFSSVAPGATATNAVSINTTEWTLTPAKGLMIVTTDNKNGAKQAQLIGLSR